MLVEVRCNEFKDDGIVRPPIRFHPGLNVVLGTAKGTNSIGKSTFLMILDFVFGGNDYAKKIRDAVRHVGEHEIQFAFQFEEVRYCFSRRTDSFTEVCRCTEDYRPVETLSIQQYREFLSSQYQMPDNGLSFRETVSRFIRVYHRENHNELRPLDSHPKEKGSSVIDFLLKMFGKFPALESAQSQAEMAKNKFNAFHDGVKYGHIVSVSTKDEEKKLKERLDDLRRRQNVTAISAELKTKSADEAIRTARLKRDLQISRAKATRLKDKLDRLESQIAKTDVDFMEDFREIQRLFPSISLKRLEEVEAFHRSLANILSHEVADEIETTRGEQEAIRREIETLETALAVNPEMDEIPRQVLTEYAKYATEIKDIENRLEKRTLETSLKADFQSLSKRLKDMKTDALESIQTDINDAMSDIDVRIFGGMKQPPRIDLQPANYKFQTLNDEGTGTAYKSMAVLDLAFLQLTSLPILVHDSLILKNIGDDPLSKLIQLYIQQAPKQVFIALDKADSYDEQTCAALERFMVLRLSDDQGALFGKSWSKKESTT